MPMVPKIQSAYFGVDTPETTLSRVSPDEFAGIPDTTAGRDHLFNWGESERQLSPKMN